MRICRLLDFLLMCSLANWPSKSNSWCASATVVQSEQSMSAFTVDISYAYSAIQIHGMLNSFSMVPHDYVCTNLLGSAGVITMAKGSSFTCRYLWRYLQSSCETNK